MTLKISQINFFSFNFKLNKKKKVLLQKTWFGDGSHRKMWGGMVGLIFNSRLEIFQTKGCLTRKRWRQNRDGAVISKETMIG